MLGLGSSIVHGSLGGYVLIDTYTSDFTGGAGDDSSTWSDFNVEGGGSTFTTNTAATFLGSMGGNCLKVEFNDNQTVSSGIQSTLDSRTWEIGDKLVYSYLIYIAGDWEASQETEITFIHLWGGSHSRAHDQLTSMTTGTISHGVLSTYQLAQPKIPQDAVVGINGVAHIQNIPGGTASSLGILASVGSQEPQDGAIIFIKDLEIKTYRRFG
mgnify:CR=1 FL=1|jgi:hypothetical protein|tara:strand:- start:328 stop:963 length:636 start_codon:yes stop_codon:yes gene_type:complete